MRYLLVILLFVGCAEESDEPAVLPPSNLTVILDESQSNEGIISVQASADNANYFEVDYGVGDGFERLINGSGMYTYSASGNYNIRVRAHTSVEVFVEETIMINISIDRHIDDSGYTTPESYAGYDLIWQDEFSGTELSSDWTYEIGTGSNGWGNNELQYYRRENASVSNGFLVIQAREENFNSNSYTSSRIITQNRQSFQYGRIDIRAKLPEGQGIWPALWMLGDSFSTVGWPDCGEIDIMEMIGGSGRENTVHGTIHWDNNGSYASFGGDYSLSSGTFTDEFHVFSIIWDASSIEWYVDDILYHTVDITPAGMSEFRDSFFLIFNVAVGGNWPGSPDATTSFPQSMIVDYVRVFQPN